MGFIVADEFHTNTGDLSIIAERRKDRVLAIAVTGGDNYAKSRMEAIIQLLANGVITVTMHDVVMEFYPVLSNGVWERIGVYDVSWIADPA